MRKRNKKAEKVAILAALVAICLYTIRMMGGDEINLNISNVLTGACYFVYLNNYVLWALTLKLATGIALFVFMMGYAFWLAGDDE